MSAPSASNLVTRWGRAGASRLDITMDRHKVILERYCSEGRELMNELPRRKALLWGLQVLSAAIVLPLTTRRADADDACVDPSSQSFRAAVHYSDPAPDPAQSCAFCAFFTMEKAPCGNCALAKGPVSSKGHCDSWSDRNG